MAGRGPYHGGGTIIRPTAHGDPKWKEESEFATSSGSKLTSNQLQVEIASMEKRLWTQYKSKQITSTLKTVEALIDKSGTFEDAVNARQELVKKYCFLNLCELHLDLTRNSSRRMGSNTRGRWKKLAAGRLKIITRDQL